MAEPPRARATAVLPLARVARIFAYGATMMIGALAVLYHGLQTGPRDRALTLAFGTFVLFQVFSVFNARNESGSAFNAQFFRNRMLWGSLVRALALQLVATHWPLASELFRTSGMAWADWGIAAGTASSVLVLAEGRNLAVRVWQRLFSKPIAQVA